MVDDISILLISPTIAPLPARMQTCVNNVIIDGVGVFIKK